MTRRAWGLALAAAIATTACGGGADDAESTTTAITTTTAAPTSTTTSTTTVATATTTTAAPVTTAAPTTAPGPDPACVTELPIAERVAMLVWPAAWSSRWDEAETAVADVGVGGVVLMRPDGWTADDVATRLAALEGVSRRGLVVATDEEGGEVQRLDVLGPLPSQLDVSNASTPEEARRLVADHGRLVRAVGVDMVLGPVVDVAPADGDAPLQRSRLFAGGPAEVTAYARAYLDGWADADLVPMLKHYPGHGAASGDTHVVDGVTPPLDQLAERDLAPYRAFADDPPAVMVGHLTVPGLTDGVPATRSPAAIAYLRDVLGYGDALVMTDALGMAAVGLPEPEASVLAMAAGIDVVIFTDTRRAADVVDAIVRAVADGTVEESHVDDAATRVMRVLQRDGHDC